MVFTLHARSCNILSFIAAADALINITVLFLLIVQPFKLQHSAPTWTLRLLYAFPLVEKGTVRWTHTSGKTPPRAARLRDFARRLAPTFAFSPHPSFRT